ncbi:MAG: hypothetical protein FWC54_00855 [Actinomycetia bacterium]|nr:hypothetical protein [Actinomycetes bacterium]
MAQNDGNVRFASSFSQEMPLSALLKLHLLEKTVRFRHFVPAQVDFVTSGYSEPAKRLVEKK